MRYTAIGLAGFVGAMALAMDSAPVLPSMGGYTNRHHGWGGKRGKLKPRSKGQQPRLSKAQRRARAA